MARKLMKKEITKTTVNAGRIVKGENGELSVEKLEDVVLVGNVDQEKAQKEMNKRYDFPVTVFGVEANTETYQLAVEDFLKYATLVQPEEATA